MPCDPPAKPLSGRRAKPSPPGRPLAYTTVMTLLDRLARKGALSRRQAGRPFLYIPVLAQDTLRLPRPRPALISTNRPFPPNRRQPGSLVRSGARK
jgi:hypothetical protein